MKVLFKGNCYSTFPVLLALGGALAKALFYTGRGNSAEVVTILTEEPADAAGEGDGRGPQVTTVKSAHILSQRGSVAKNTTTVFSST